MDTDLLQRAAAQAKTGWLEKALTTLLPQVWELTIASPNWQEKAAVWADQIDQMFIAQKLTTPSQQKNRRTDIANALRVIHPEHPAIAHVLLPSNVYTVMNNEQASRLNARENKFFTSQQANQLVERAIALLDSEEPDEVAAGLAVLVGRRISEILLSQFKAKTAYSLLFSEAVKRRGDVGLEFEIPTLAPADPVLKAIAHLKQVWSIEELRALNLPDNHLKRRINARYSGVPHACRQHFADLVPGREAENDDGERLYTHLFRAVYAEIAAYYYKPQWVPDHRFKAEIQGHFKLTTDGQKLPNYSARQNYDDYLIRDRSPGESGVKLGLPGVKILAVFQKERMRVESEAVEQMVKEPPSRFQLEQGTINALLYRAVDRLLFSKQWAEVATGLLLVTGRTIDALLSTIPTSKTGFSILVEKIEVPTLTPAKQVISAWHQFRQLPPLPVPQIERAVQAVGDHSFHDLLPIHGVEPLRALYSCLALHWFCPPGVPEAAFLSAIASPDPMPFETANPNRGLKLAQHNVEVLELFQSQTQSVHQEEVATMPDTPTETSAVAEVAPTETAPTKLRPRRKPVSVDADLLRSVAANFGLEIRGKAGTVGLSYEAALAELLSLLAEPDEGRSRAEVPSDEPIPATAPRPTTPSDPALALALTDQARTLAWLTGRLEALEQEVSTLRQERDAALQQLNQGAPSTELGQLQQENERLKLERDQATSKLETFRQLLMGDRLTAHCVRLYADDSICEERCDNA
ncbi:protelomerase family protein [Trichocoleus sp. FACHB-262]|uniref:protelomerase family protein n=1 Tax=Trichocoleus sp. FACHB-262 TaxID=2692869 RepID=UPI0016882B18|nr:protelomerase family protein [Trichocoleus sp. FACHB-262]MBD2120285.1 hypothetical protein [Trichocoleus sp. FACHB-262]